MAQGDVRVTRLTEENGMLSHTVAEWTAKFLQLDAEHQHLLSSAFAPITRRHDELIVLIGHCYREYGSVNSELTALKDQVQALTVSLDERAQQLDQLRHSLLLNSQQLDEARLNLAFDSA